MVGDRATDAADGGKRIRDLRRARGLSQEQLGAPDLSSSYISRIESGSRVPGPRLLQQLADRLGTTAEHLLTGVAPQQREQARLRLLGARFALESGNAGGALGELRLLSGGASTGFDAAMQREAAQLAARALEQVGRLRESLNAWRALVAQRPVGDQLWGEAAVAVTRLYRLLGDFGLSIESGEASLRAIESAGLGSTPDAVRLQLTLMAAYEERGDLTRAMELGEAAQDRARTTGDPALVGQALWNTSLTLIEQGRLEEAVDVAARAVDALALVNIPRDLALVRIVHAQCLSATGDPAAAVALLQQASVELAIVGSSTDVAFLDLEFARAAVTLGELGTALEHADRVLAADGVTPLQSAEAQLLRGRAELLGGRGAQARGALTDAASRLAATGATRMAGRVWMELAASLDTSGDIEGARDAYRAAAVCAGLSAPAHTAEPGLLQNR